MGTDCADDADFGETVGEGAGDVFCVVRLGPVTVLLLSSNKDPNKNDRNGLLDGMLCGALSDEYEMMLISMYVWYCSILLGCNVFLVYDKQKHVQTQVLSLEV